MVEEDKDFLNREIAKGGKETKKTLGIITQPSEENLRLLDKTFKDHDRFVERFTQWRKTAKPRIVVSD